jgi:hypothetical protein
MRTGAGRWGCAALLLLSASLPAPVLAFTLGDHRAADGDTRIELQADTTRYDRAAQRVEATGHVRATRAGAVLTVDRLVWEQATGVVTAEGNVQIVDGDNELLADRIVWRLNDQTGEVRGGRLVLEGRYNLEGARIERLGPDLYEVERGLFSTCPCHANGKRDWSVTARHMRMRVPGTLVARSVQFRVHEVPVLYMPVFLFPTSGRQTGLLIPNMGWDTRDGARFEQPFYWAINPSNDLTVSLDVRTRRGTGGEVLYRYMTSRATRGDVRLYALSDRETDQVQGEGRWRHTTRRPGGWTLHADINAVNNRDFLRQLSDGTEERTADRLESNVYASRTRGDAAALLLARRTINLTASTDTTVQQLPRLRLERFPVRVGPLPVWASGHVDAMYLYRETGPTAVRTEAAPELAGRVPLWGGRLTAVPRAGARIVWYGPGANATGDRVAEMFPMSVTVSGTARGTLWGRPHLLAPELRYRYAPVNRATTGTFDALEEVRTEHEAGIGLRQRLGPVRWRLGASYDLEQGTSLPFRSEWDTDPSRAGALHLDTLHAADGGRIERLVADWRVRWGWGTLMAGTLVDRGTVGIGTPLAPGTLLADGSGQRSHFDTAGLALGPWRGLTLTHRTYYDREDGRLAEVRYGLSFHGVCWTAQVTYVDLPDRNLIQFRLGLVGPPEAPALPREVRTPLFGDG